MFWWYWRQAGNHHCISWDRLLRGRHWDLLHLIMNMIAALIEYYDNTVAHCNRGNNVVFCVLQHAWVGRTELPEFTFSTLSGCTCSPTLSRACRRGQPGSSVWSNQIQESSWTFVHCLSTHDNLRPYQGPYSYQTSYFHFTRRSLVQIAILSATIDQTKSPSERNSALVDTPISRSHVRSSNPNFLINSFAHLSRNQMLHWMSVHTDI